MKNWHKWLIVFLLVGLVTMLVISILNDRKAEANKNSFEFPSSLQVTNYSGKSYIDTIALVTLYNIMEYDSIDLSIHDMPYDMSTETHQIAGYMTVNPFQRHVYFLFVDPQCTTVSNVNLIAHEMEHLKQYEAGYLIPLSDNSGVIYKGDTIRFKSVPYEKRQHEIDAFKQEPITAKLLNKLIYNR